MRYYIDKRPLSHLFAYCYHYHGLARPNYRNDTLVLVTDDGQIMTIRNLPSHMHISTHVY